jgi:PEP-CTERM motif
MKIKHLLVTGAFFASSAYGALAEPITYKFVVQGGVGNIPGFGTLTGYTAVLGGKSVVTADDDDVITFTFTADTSTVQPFSIPGAAHGFVNDVGTGSFSIVSNVTMETVATGTFLAGDGIFVSVDNQNGGIGFGSLSSPPGDPNFPGDAAYPLGVESSNLATYDLQSEIGIFGSGSLSCAGFPGACILPPILDTTAGDLVLAGSGPNGSQSSPEGNFVAEFTTGGGGNPPPPPAPVPEPSTWAMMLLGFAGLGYTGCRKARPASVNA